MCTSATTRRGDSEVGARGGCARRRESRCARESNRASVDSQPRSQKFVCEDAASSGGGGGSMGICRRERRGLIYGVVGSRCGDLNRELGQFRWVERVSRSKESMETLG